MIGDYDLVLITGKDLEHVWEQNDCRSKEIREITIQFSSDLFFKSFINKNQFDSIRRMLDKAQKGLCFPMSAILKIYPLLDTLASEKQGFYAVIKFMTILYELSLFEEEARTLSSSSFAKIDILPCLLPRFVMSAVSITFPILIVSLKRKRVVRPKSSVRTTGRKRN